MQRSFSQLCDLFTLMTFVISHCFPLYSCIIYFLYSLFSFIYNLGLHLCWSADSRVGHMSRRSRKNFWLNRLKSEITIKSFSFFFYIVLDLITSISFTHREEHQCCPPLSCLFFYCLSLIPSLPETTHLKQLTVTRVCVFVCTCTSV